MNNEIEHLSKLVKTYEEHNLKIPVLEKRLKTMKINFESEMRKMEEQYKEKISTLNLKVKKYEDIINFNRHSTLEDDLDKVNVIFSNSVHP
jgi:hypothetical protein